MDTSEANQIEMDKACSAPAKVFFSGEKLNRFWTGMPLAMKTEQHVVGGEGAESR